VSEANRRMDKGRKHKGQKVTRHTNILEALKDIGGVEKTASDVMGQVFGPRPQKNFSAEFSVGESLEISQVISGEHEKRRKLKMQLVLERKLRIEEEVRTKKKGEELKVQLHALMQEVSVLAETTEGLGQETKVAAMQAPAEPGVYHLIYFEKLLEFIKSFRKKIEDARVWLHATNKRAQKKNYWSRYKKHGGKFLLSGEHYLTRSAG